MKKFLTVLLALLTCATLMAGCKAPADQGGANEPPQGEQPEKPEPEKPEEPEKPAEPEEPDWLKAEGVKEHLSAGAT